MQVYHALAVAVLVIHLLWIGWVIFGALLTRHRRALRAIHIASLIYSIFIEIAPWPPCLLTVLEQWFEARSGVEPYHGPFLLHYLDALVYPDVSLTVLVVCAVGVCAFNLGIYIFRYRRRDQTGW